MVVPWVGFPLADLLKRFEPTSKAKYVQFFTLARPRRRCRGFAIPCSSGPIAKGSRSPRRCIRSRSLAVGLYGKVLPNQNGAPLRIVIPWKYGFKGAKSDRAHPLPRDSQPETSWNMAAPQRVRLLLERESDEVDHPRWSQATERRLGGGLFSARIPTQMFNGYADQVAQPLHGPRPPQELLIRAAAGRRNDAAPPGRPQGAGVRRVLVPLALLVMKAAGDRLDVARRESRRGSARTPAARPRLNLLDAHAVRHADPARDGLQQARRVPPDARAIRVLLRAAALSDLCAARSRALRRGTRCSSTSRSGRTSRSDSPRSCCWCRWP